MGIKIVPDPRNERIVAYMGRISESVVRGIRQAHYFIGNDLLINTKNSLTGRKSGRVYLKRLRSSGRQVRHRASAPGETPANFNYDFNNSLNYELRGSDSLIFGSADKVGNEPVPYGVFLERGTRKMDPRPWLEPSVKNEIKNATEHYEREVMRSIDEAKPY